MTNRQKEDKQMESLKDPNENHSGEISRLISKTLANKHNVYLATDWHLWVRKEKGKAECHKRKDFEQIIKTVNETMGKDDVLIYLGDLVDGEFKDKESLKTVLQTIPGKKIMTLGNNDIFGIPFYKSCGFDYVVQSFVWADVLFCHVPVENKNQINVHGHIHSNQYPPVYWIPYSNQIDVAWLGGREKPIPIHDAITSQKKFSKVIKEDPSHFNEGYTLPIHNETFLDVMDSGENCFTPDPYDAI